MSTSLPLVARWTRQWHPERFARCSEDVRIEFQEKATVMVQVLGQLLVNVAVDVAKYCSG